MLYKSISLSAFSNLGRKYHTGVYFRNNFDDNEESILKRIDSYNQMTKPVADKFGAKIVSAERTADEIFADVQPIMDGVK
jgi:adenylate kinase family enzyme